MDILLKNSQFSEMNSPKNWSKSWGPGKHNHQQALSPAPNRFFSLVLFYSLIFLPGILHLKPRKLGSLQAIWTSAELQPLWLWAWTRGEKHM